MVAAGMLSQRVSSTLGEPSPATIVMLEGVGAEPWTLAATLSQLEPVERYSGPPLESVA